MPQEAQTPAPRSRPPAVVVLVLLLFLGLGVVSVVRHEMWRDELRHWLLASTSTSLRDLLHHVRYEGHPLLWPLLVKLVSLAWLRPEAMQYLHLALAGVAVGLFFLSPFQLHHRILFAFGYYAVFEYAVVARSYVLGMVLLFAACAAWPRRGERPWRLYLPLFLLGQTSLYGLFISWSFGLATAWDLAQRRGWNRQALREGGALVAVLLVAAVTALLAIIPAPGYGTLPLWHTSWEPERLGWTGGTVWAGLVVLPRPVLTFWNTNLVDVPLVQGALGLLLLAGLGLWFARRPVALLVFVPAAVLILLFTYLKTLGAVRHYGHFYLLALAALWLAHDTAARPLPWPRLDACATTLERQRDLLLTVLLAVHVVAGLFAVTMDWGFPFSSSRAAARFIQARYPQHEIVADHYRAGEALAGYLQRPLCYPGKHHYGYYCEQDREEYPVTVGDVLLAADALAAKGRPVLVAFSYAVGQHLPPRTPGGRLLTPVFVTPLTIVADERFYLYVLDGPASLGP